MEFLFVCCVLLTASLSEAGHQSTYSAFENAGRKPGVEVWRVEKFIPVAVAETDYGRFHTGDSYVVLSTKQRTQNSRVFSWDIYTWIGAETSNDEAAVATMCLVALDNLLGGGPVQHREEQGEESPGFLSLFNNGLSYLPGGVPSGLRYTD